MKIAIFTDVLLEVPGGIGSSISAAKKSLEAAGHQVVIFAPGWHPEQDPSIIVIPTLKFFKPNGAPWARRPSIITEWITKNHPEIADFDLFHAHYEGPVSLAAIELSRRYGKPLIQSLHGREDQALSHNIPLLCQNLVASLLDALHAKSLRRIEQKYPQKASASAQNASKTAKNTPKSAKITEKSSGITPEPPQKLLLHPRLAPNKPRAKMWRIIVSQGNAANLVIAPSQHFADKLQQMGLKTSIRLLPNGIDDDIVPINPQPRTWPQGTPLKILWNSRLSHEKRFLPLLEALKIAGEQGLQYELIAFGSGNELKKAQKYVKQHHLSVKFMGTASRPRILRESTHCQLAAITSHDFDVHSLILVEAEAAGTPLLICDPDMTGSLAKGTFVLTATPAPQDIAAALLSLTPVHITTMSEKMLAHRPTVYQSSRIAELLEIYRNLSYNRGE